MSIDLKTFEPIYKRYKNKEEVISNLIKKSLKVGKENIFLASDEDREPLDPISALNFECQQVLTWCEWIDQLEIALLAAATEINIHPVQLEVNYTASTNLRTYLGDAYILFINNNHYQVLVKKDRDAK